ncbi:nuclear transport factor 2 family protein [Tsukamurella soli]|uniref:DUF4440 domain-containing protein n=1 Tax=Tsukamurella soli TaxID=644556 RepID=A0ABP8JQ10_9ACTN
MTTNANATALDRLDSDADAAVTELIQALQEGHDTGDADRYDSFFAADVVWGTPKGQVVRGFRPLNAIHHRMMDPGPVAPRSRFELVHSIRPAPGVVVAQIRRRGEAGGFSESAMYVLVRGADGWSLAAAQNTPVTDTLPA